jgi:hypothetical protein
MDRPICRGLCLAALFLATAGIAGCSEDDSRAAELAKGALGVKDTQAQTQPKKVVYRKTEEIIDPETNKVLTSTVEEKPVTIQVEIKRDVKVETGEAHARTAQVAD